MPSKKKAIEIPDVIRELPAVAGEKREQEMKKRTRDSKKDAERRHAREALQKKEKERNRRATLPHARKIFSWAQALRESETGQKLIHIGDRIGCTGFCFFDGKPPGTRQMWLGIDDQGLWRHGFG